VGTGYNGSIQGFVVGVVDVTMDVAYIAVARDHLYLWKKSHGGRLSCINLKTFEEVTRRALLVL
jgi:hypothetical protein